MGRFAAKAARGRFAQTVIAKYKAYLDNPEVAKQDNPVTNRPKSKRLYVLPFGITMPASVLAIASSSEPVITSYTSNVNAGGTRIKTALTNTEKALDLADFAAARVAIRTGRSATGTDKKSKTSGLPYKSYGGKSVSIAFGAKDATEDLKTAFTAIRASILGGAGSNPPSVALIPEKVPGA